jgi:3-phosphoshikimate 1-carboxyvinyltransferase
MVDVVVNSDGNRDINTNHDINTIKDINYLNITIPGDEILAAALLCLKCISPKGDLTISNAPLESWATQTLSFIKKMGCHVNVKEEGKTSFGVRGSLAVKKSACNGRKVRCLPHYQYFGQLPAMAVASAFAEGKSVFRELQPLRLCEPDGLDQLEQCLRPLGARHGEMPDGIVVEGAKEFDGFDILEPLPAHIAAAFCMAGLKCRGKTSIADDFIFARWPDFEKMLNDICEFRSK